MFFHLSSRCLNDFLRFSALYPHGSSCHLLQNFPLLALTHDVLKVIAWKALSVLHEVQPFPFSSPKDFKLDVQLRLLRWHVKSDWCPLFSETLVHNWFFSVFWVLKCTLSFATPVSFWLLLPGRCRHLCLPIPLTFPRAAAECLTSHTHSSSLDLNFSKDSRALCGDAAVFIYCPEYCWVW